MITGRNGPYNAYEVLEFIEKMGISSNPNNLSETALVQASTMPIKELIEKLESLAYLMHSPILREAANRLRNASCATTILEDSLFYARMYRDTTADGDNRRRMLIDDAETVVSLIRTGGCE